MTCTLRSFMPGCAGSAHTVMSRSPDVALTGWPALGAGVTNPAVCAALPCAGPGGETVYRLDDARRHKNRDADDRHGGKAANHATDQTSRISYRAHNRRHDKKELHEAADPDPAGHQVAPVHGRLQAAAAAGRRVA